MYRRRYTNGLDTKRVKELTHGWQHAARIGRQLNVMITIRPFDDQEPATHCKVAAAIRNKLGVYARQHGFPFVAAWSRECNEDGSGEHLHILMHVPPKYSADLSATVIRWFPEPGAADVQRAHQVVTLTATGKRMSAIGYIAKQMTPQAWYKRGLIRKRGGPVLGKRGGVTRNIGAAAIDQYFAGLRTACAKIPGQNGGRVIFEPASSPTWDMEQHREEQLRMVTDPVGSAFPKPSTSEQRQHSRSSREFIDASRGLADASRGLAKVSTKLAKPFDDSGIGQPLFTKSAQVQSGTDRLLIRTRGIEAVTVEGGLSVTDPGILFVAGPGRRSINRRALAERVTRLSRSSATGPIDNYPGGFSLH
jgi:hypothetical protein